MKTNRFLRILENKKELNLAIVSTVSVLLSILFYTINPVIKSPWIVFTAAFLPLLITGKSRKVQCFYFIIIAIIVSLSTVATYYLQFNLLILLIWIFLVTFFSVLLPRFFYIPPTWPPFILVFIATTFSLPFTSSAQQGIAIMIGAFIAIISYIIFNRFYQKDVVHDQSSYLIKRALRVAIAITLTLAITHIGNFFSPAWAMYSVIVVHQAHFFKSMRKGIQRLIGTVFGIVVGTYLGHYLFSVYPASRILAILIFFSIFILINRYYTLAAFLITLLVAIAFYFSHGPTDIYHFMLARLADTALGIGVALLSEILIFPRFGPQPPSEGQAAK